MNPHVLAITATCGRHFCIERVVKFFIDQDYVGEHTMLIYNNSEVNQALNLPPLPENKRIILVNKHTDSKTKEPYKTLGAIYNDIVQNIEIPEALSAEVICFMDDDDIFLPNHITEGVKGYVEAKSKGLKAYKPSHSYYRHAGGVALVQNTLEPSIFIEAKHVKKYGFSNTTSDQHLQWVNPLVQEGSILVKEGAPATLVYNWGDNFWTFKTSGDPHNPQNFSNYRAHSLDHGDKVISPLDEVSEYYKV